MRMFTVSVAKTVRTEAEFAVEAASPGEAERLTREACASDDAWLQHGIQTLIDKEFTVAAAAPNAHGRASHSHLTLELTPS